MTTVILANELRQSDVVIRRTGPSGIRTLCNVGLEIHARLRSGELLKISRYTLIQIEVRKAVQC